MNDTRLRSRFRELRERFFSGREKWRLAVGAQDLASARQRKTSAHRILRKSWAVEKKAYRRGEWWAGGSYED